MGPSRTAVGAAVAALVAALIDAGPAVAHGFGQRYDLPVPLAIWVAGAAAAVALSFAVIGGVAGEPGRRDYPRLNLLRVWPGRVLAARAIRVVLRAAAVALLALVVIAGFAGDQTPTRNLAPTWVWIIWWVGLAYVSALAGDLWTVVDPWAAVFAWGEAGWRRLVGRAPRPPWRYPAALGRWPAVVLFAAFAWAELVYVGRSVPARLAAMIAVYSVIAWTGMFLIGRPAWRENADPFANAFGILARFAPTEARVTSRAGCVRCPEGCAGDAACLGCGPCFDRAAPAERQWNLRPYGAGLLDAGPVSVSTAAFVLLLLSSVTFDGLTATPAWAAVEGALYGALAPLGDARLTLIGTVGLLAVPAAFAAVYGGCAAWMARMAGDGRPAAQVACLFVLSLVPIAIAYHLAHYLTFLLVQGQLVIRLASDPLGLGWNLFGTARFRPDIGLVGARTAWYAGVGAIVAGHIVAVYVAHAIALREYPTRRAAIRSQVPMLVLMIAYTVASLWIIAQPIVETGARG